MAEVREIEAKDKTYDRLRKQGAIEFEGITDLEIAEEWLQETDRVLDRLDCTPEQKLKNVVSLLRRSALDWWDLIPGSKNKPMTLTWDDFLREFANKYTPPMYTDRKKMEFLSLEQEYVTVSEYEMQFSQLSKYALEEVATEDAK
ncbi:uncharacterized protein LOC107261330 [Ricinus communis]|uniref:uncharacterized protein LOC107261330 n=1 Tax=Ricinus communis TaxID=3988 RepID=UPI0007728226|nr:uncharacterized protein LOC107261330 [Ricinus communis]|eukprot:XP_015575330.1 uncharacterized protein LOC107261330 [Ricinus communis]